MFTLLLPVVAGFVFRHIILTGLGTALLALNLPPELASQIVAYVQALGPVAGSALGGLLIAVALGWSYVQKKRSGVLDPE